VQKKVLMRGNEALAEASIRAGCRYYFGYPITPQNEISEYMARRLPEVGGVFVQAESEVAAINMVFGAGACGVRVLTTSSSPGISLMQEGISYIAGAETPAVIVNMMRGGPGLGNIAPSQADYLQAVKGGGHGDYHTIVLGPESVQELVNLAKQAFDLALKYRNPVMILGDGILGQMSEPVILPEMIEANDKTDWAIGNKKEQVIIKSLYLIPENSLEVHNNKLQVKYDKIQNECRIFEKYLTDDAEYLLAAYGTSARIAKAAIQLLRNNGVKAGLFRPITLWPFPDLEFSTCLNNIKKIFVFEMAHNQFEQDIKLAANGKVGIKGFYKLGGAVFSEQNIYDSVMNEIGKGSK
jgi:2-oxoglutarate/2-oxoacid ferredoxin oxidoreductase subunit alpha